MNGNYTIIGNAVPQRAEFGRAEMQGEGRIRAKLKKINRKK